MAARPIALAAAAAIGASLVLPAGPAAGSRAGIPRTGGGARGSAVAVVLPPLARHDVVPVRSSADRLAIPPPTVLAPNRPTHPSALATATAARYRYALSFVAIPLRGWRLGFSRARMRALTSRVAARMATQTGGRFSYGFASWTVAPKAPAGRLPCDIYQLHAQYRRYAKGVNTPPPGYRDTITVYVTPPRPACDFAGIAMLGGRATYLNGIYRGQHLQDWITAHELGHNLGLDHSASFWPSDASWEPDQRVPVNERAQGVAVYGDYLDLMGQPPDGGRDLPGADLGRWVFNSLSLYGLGVLTDRNVTYARTSGTYTLRSLRPARAGGAMLLAVPTVADRQRTFWVLELRPPEGNAGSLRYPAPYPARGYGVRLLMLAHGRGAFLNKVFKRSPRPAAQVALPLLSPVRLGGGGTVTVLRRDAASATVRVTLPD